MGELIRYRVFWNGKMYYPDTEDKPCDWLLDQSGNVQSFPNQLHIVYDPAQYEGAIAMLSTGMVDRDGREVWVGDIVSLGVNVWPCRDRAIEMAVTFTSLPAAETKGFYLQCEEISYVPAGAVKYGEVVGNVHEKK